MTSQPAPESAIDRVRAAALVLPEVEEQSVARQATFLVAGTPFARMADDERLQLKAAAGWTDLPLAGDVDWALVEDGIARAWELAAPRGLLEAGGR